MPVPKRKRSRSRRDKRFANKGLKTASFGQCSQSDCQTPILPHQACASCGYYKGAKVLDTKADRGVKRQEKKQARQKDEQPTLKPTE